MPPKAKYSKEEMIEKAIQIIIEQGIENLTARELAKALDTSVKPIFTAFENMEDLKQSTFDYAFTIYHKQFEKFQNEPDFFRSLGFAYIDFAINEPKLFQLLFMKFQEEKLEFSDFMKKLDDCYEDTISVISKQMNINNVQAEKLYTHMWIYCHGIATLCATNQCKFTQDDVGRLMTVAFNGFLNEIQKGE